MFGRGVPEISCESFYRGIAACGRRLASEAVFELTYRCNLNCCHCYCNTEKLRRREAELSADQICRLIDDAAGQGCLWLAFTGGEPLLRSDFRQLYLYAKRAGMLVTVLTNGTLIDRDMADFFEQWPPLQIELSLYGMTPEVYEQIIGVPGSFRQCMQAIRLLHERGIRLQIKTMALTVNQHQIRQISDFAASLDCQFRYDGLVHCRLDGDKTPHRFRIQTKELVDLDEELGYVRKEWLERCRLYAGTQVDRHALFICGAGKAMFQVSPSGMLQTCSFPLKHGYDLTAGSFVQGWQEFFPRVTGRQRSSAAYACQDCRLRPLCPQCPNWSFLETGDEEQVVEYVCALTRERAVRFGTGPLTGEKDAEEKGVPEAAAHPY